MKNKSRQVEIVQTANSITIKNLKPEEIIALYSAVMDGSMWVKKSHGTLVGATKDEICSSDNMLT
jgi:hypothetical protein